MALPILDFLVKRVKEYDSSFEYRSGTPYSSLFFQPLQYIAQPLRDEMDATLVNQSLRRILKLEDPDTYAEDSVSDIVENIYVYRFEGGKSVGNGRLYFTEPVARDYLTGSLTFYSKASLVFPNSQPVSITADQMALNLDGGLYYVDIPVEAETEGDQYNIPIDDLVTVSGDDDAVKIGNPAAFTEGLPRESNTSYITRAQNSIGVRDLVTGKGINAVLNEAFPGQFNEIISIGFGDAEMMRDIAYNTHIGSKTDVYMKPLAFSQTYLDVIGLVFDQTRRLRYESQMVMDGVDWLATGTPYIDRTDMQPLVESTDVETAAEIETIAIPEAGIDLSAGEWIKLEVDDRTAIHIKISGVDPTATQRNEIINNVNNAFGFTLCFVRATKVVFKSPSIGFGSRLVFSTPTSPRTDATTLIFTGLSTYPPDETIQGTYPTTYIDGSDYIFDDEAGTIKRLAGGTITDGQLVVLKYDANPLSVDVGNLVPLVESDMGIVTSRGIRTGREAYTIQNMAFINVVQIDEIDPETREITSTTPLVGRSGYGLGGYGMGPYGVGSYADYRFRVLSPHERFSAFENSLITFKPEFFGRSFRITYNYSPKIVDVHNFCFSDAERVTDASVLAKNAIPAIVSFSVRMKVDATDITIPDDATIIDELSGHINALKGVSSQMRLEKSDLLKILNKYADYVDVNFVLNASVYNNDGSVRIYSNIDLIEIENVTLAKDTDNVATPRIVRFYAGAITITRI